MSAPILDIVKATDTKTKPQDLKAQDSKSKDDNAEKKNVSESETEDRFDSKPLKCFQNRCIFWDGLLQSQGLTTNKTQSVCESFKGSFPGIFTFHCSCERNSWF